MSEGGWGFQGAGAEIWLGSPPEACFCQRGKRRRRLLQVSLCPEVAFCGPFPHAPASMRAAPESLGTCSGHLALLTSGDACLAQLTWGSEAVMSWRASSDTCGQPHRREGV